MSRLQSDILFGKKYEKIVLSYLNKHTPYESDWFVAYKYNFKRVDFRSWKMICELKTRPNNSSTFYADTMFGENKLDYINGIKEDTRLFRFLFLFTDGLFYWDYVKGGNQLNIEYEIRPYYHQEKLRYEPYAYVKKEYLVKVTDEITSRSKPQHDQDKYILKDS